MQRYEEEEDKIKVPRFEESAGFYTSTQRSYTMSRIKSKNSKPELLLRKALWAKNIRFRLHDKSLHGRPDIVIKKYKLAIFVDGEFWHGFDWKKNRERIKSNRLFWIPKIERNMQKDERTNRALRDMGYTVFRFWSQDVLKSLPKVLNQIELFLETRKLWK
ncbi:very short patch repair endonuclease [Sphingobacterium alkalisoli]|uniref:Very short patch repair endonuclease n=1 Tax=Sphingobacterium alkalisoli TaxID=1874115 RepID=A0A4U0H2V0_9SPHI|nr:very short patch repair endonuclease [Sphingobacterium alkalisoli]TJY65826.1 very short patch repair endonuclease [Sphingobacterium alkalisoli]GGH18081.1 very short patch repair endonuclease [Sphingobacterium alkalisoli]